MAPKKRGRKSTNPYWGPEEEKAVVDFLNVGQTIEIKNKKGEVQKVLWSGDTKEERQRNKIYNDKLRAPLDKMIESIIRKYKLYSKEMLFEDLHSDTLSFLMIKFHKFAPEKNKKSYSYYGTVCKHYLLGKLIKEDKGMKTLISYEDISSSLEEDEKYSYEIENENINLSVLMEKVSSTIKEEIETSVLSDNELLVGTALIKILDDWEQLFDSVPGKNKFNKNLILYYMREITSLTTKDIRNSMKRYKIIYDVMKKDLI
jgi:hypothetical protein